MSLACLDILAYCLVKFLIIDQLRNIDLLRSNKVEYTESLKLHKNLPTIGQTVPSLDKIKGVTKPQSPQHQQQTEDGPFSRAFHQRLRQED